MSRHKACDKFGLLAGRGQSGRGPEIDGAASHVVLIYPLLPRHKFRSREKNGQISLCLGGRKLGAKRYRAGELMVEGMETSLLLDGD